MCTGEGIPPAGHLAAIENAVHLQGPREAIDDEDSIQRPNGDVQRVGNALYCYNEAREHHELRLSDGRRVLYELVLFYDNLVATMRRREVQMFTPTDISVTRYMCRWIELTFPIPNESPVPESKAATGVVFEFQELLELYLPVRLDAYSWVGRLLLTLYGHTNPDVEMPWGSFRARRRIQPEPETTVYYEEGKSLSPNRGVYFGPRDDVKMSAIVFVPKFVEPHPMTEKVSRQYAKTLYRLGQLEYCLMSIARRFAYQVTRLIVQLLIDEYNEHGQPVLRREQIGMAVREILGEEWFHLPFDESKWVENWSAENDVLMPDDVIMTGMQAFPGELLPIGELLLL